MTRLFKQLTNWIGQPPGSLKPASHGKSVEPRIAVLEYSPQDFAEEADIAIEEALASLGAEGVSWINIDQVDVSTLHFLGERLGIHPLVLEDILHLGQRPKLDDHGEYIHAVVRMLYSDSLSGELVSEQVSIVFGEGYLITFQERRGDVFEHIRERIRAGEGRVRSMGADYLAYALLDAIVDGYFELVDSIDEQVDDIDGRLLAEADPDIIREIHDLKRKLILLRKQVWPVREVINSFIRSEGNPMVSSDTRLYLRDVYEHIIQVTEMVDSFREVVSSLHDVYLSVAGNRMNEVMKVLTIFASIFIPLTFVAGIYGMNFEYMPELSWRGGYFAALGLMLLIALGMLLLFKRKRWF